MYEGSPPEARMAARPARFSGRKTRQVSTGNRPHPESGRTADGSMVLEPLARIIHGHPAETRATLCAKERCDRKPLIEAGNALSATEIFRRDKEGRRRRPSPSQRSA